MRVKIIKCSGAEYWYNSLVGKTFEVEDYGKNDFVLKEDKERGYNCMWRHIEKCDCEYDCNPL